MITAANEDMPISVEAILLVKAAAQDRDAFCQLAEKIARPSLGLAIRIMGDHALAEDAVQDALTKLWKEAHRFDPQRGTFAAWWRRMLVNATLDSKRRLKVVAPLDEANHVPDAGPTPAMAAEQQDIASRVQAAAAHLPDRQRVAIALFYGDGLSMAEIGDVLECSEKAVEGLLLRARATLKTLLADLKD